MFEIPVSILLDEFNFSCIKSLYAHEITHFLVNRNRGSVLETINSEFLSLFIEKLNIKEDSIDYAGGEHNRWLNIKYDDVIFLSPELQLDIKTYYNSLVKANYLYYLYRNMKPYEKVKLFNNIKLIFEGKLTVEDFCCLYNINFRNNKMIEVSSASIDSAVKFKRTL